MQTGKILASTIAGAVGLAATTGAVAAEQQQPLDQRFYIAPMISYGFFDSDTLHNNSNGKAELDRDDALGGTLAIGKPINKWLNLELYGFYFNPDQTMKIRGTTGDNGNYTTGNGEIWGVGVDALLFPARDTLPVYGLLGASFGQHGINGFSSSPVTMSSDNAFTRYYDAGVGYVYPITDYGIKVRAEYRFRYSQVDLPGSGNGSAFFTDNIVSVGLQIPLGAPPQAKPVNTEPAPMPEPKDSDHDGVLNSNDACPDTPAGAKVDSTGCQIETKPEPIELQGVTFRFDKSSLTDQAQRRLRSVVSALHSAPKVDFRLDGYTDSIGTKAYNMRLSQRRVDSVKDYLLNHEISPMRITGTEGHGEANPVAPNSTKQGRAQNRRVEITVTNGPAQ